MVMQEQAKRLSEPLRWTRTGRLAVIVTSVLLVAAIATAAVLVATDGSSRHPGCIDVAFPSTLGVAEIHPCGAKARTLCANPSENPAVALHGVLREACRQAGLPYGQPAAAS